MRILLFFLEFLRFLIQCLLMIRSLSRTIHSDEEYSLMHFSEYDKFGVHAEFGDWEVENEK